MSYASLSLTMIVRLAGLIVIVLGALFWGGVALALIPLHMLVGLLLVIALWALALLALTAGIERGVALFALVWGAAVIALGLAQTSLLPGRAHWIVQAGHLVLGLGAIGFAERLGRRLRAVGAVRAITHA